MPLQKRVSELPAVPSVAATDLLIVSSANATKRCTVQQIGAFFQANGVAGPPGPAGPAGPAGGGYTLPTATASVLGGVKIGSGIAIDGSGVISASAGYTLPNATTSTLGGVIVGSGLSVSSGTVSANVTSVAGRTGAVTIAAADVAGLGSLATQSSVSYSSLTGTPSTFAPSAHSHGIADVTGFSAAAAAAAPVQSVNGQTGAVTIASYALPVATASVLGGVKAGANVTIDGTGVISVAAPVASLPYSSITGTPTLATVATSGAYADLSGRPTLGSAAAAATTDFAAASHNHAASAINSGTLDIARLPVGQTSTTVAAGNDARFTDARTPTDGSVTDAKITSGGLSTSSLNWAAIQPWAANTAYQKGDLVSNSGIAYRRSAAGTSGATFNGANWQQITPSEFVGSQITSGTVAATRLGSGSPSSANYLRGDGAWNAPTASDVGAAATAVVYEFTRTTKPAAASGSNGSYTFAIPSGAKVVEFLLIGGGGGGGSGRRGAAGTNRFGGGGGGGGGAVLAVANASTLTSSLSIQVGGAGAGGAARTTDDTDGANGGAGGVSSVTHNSVTFASASPGSGGNGGSATAGAAGTGSAIDADVFRGGVGGSSSVTAAAGSAFSPAGFGGVGGGGGGGISSGNAAFGGGTQRMNQTAQRVLLQAVYGTQAGGASSTTAAADAGASGLNYGHGGNGGGASANGFNSGAGGNGGDGYVRITVWF